MRIIYDLILLYSVHELVILKGGPKKENLQGPRDPPFFTMALYCWLICPKNHADFNQTLSGWSAYPTWELYRGVGRIKVWLFKTLEA